MVHVPYPLAMVICDAIWRDPGTGKRTLLGLFSAVFGREFPVVIPIISVHIALTDVRGRQVFKVKLVDVDEEREPVNESQEMPVEAPDPLAVLELDYAIQNATFPSPGEYRLQLFADGGLVLERRILVVSHATEGEQP